MHVWLLLIFIPLLLCIYCSHVVELSDHTFYYYSFTSFLSSDVTIMWFLAFCFSFTLFSEILYARDFSCFNQPILASAKPAKFLSRKVFGSGIHARGCLHEKLPAARWCEPHHYAKHGCTLELVQERWCELATDSSLEEVKSLRSPNGFAITLFRCLSPVAMDSPCVISMQNMPSGWNNWMHAHVCVCIVELKVTWVGFLSILLLHVRRKK